MHRKPIQRVLLPRFILLLFSSCFLWFSCGDKDNDPPTPEQPDIIACYLTQETSTKMGINETKYRYDAQFGTTKLNLIERFTGAHQKVNQSIIEGIRVIVENVNGIDTIYRFDSEVLNFADSRPSNYQISIQQPQSEPMPYQEYRFEYDGNHRLVSVIESTAHIDNDPEWTLTIAYNEQSNVRLMEYAWSGADPPPGRTITVSGYDDKRTPYGNIPVYPFLFNNYNWDNADPEPLITALSKNNPMGLAIDNGSDQTITRTITYQYDDKNLPVQRNNSETSGGINVTWAQTYSYTCN